MRTIDKDPPTSSLFFKINDLLQCSIAGDGRRIYLNREERKSKPAKTDLGEDK